MDFWLVNSFPLWHGKNAKKTQLFFTGISRKQGLKRIHMNPTGTADLSAQPNQKLKKAFLIEIVPLFHFVVVTF